MHGCRGHNCNPDDRDIHEAIPEVMAVLRENPGLQKGLLDATADNTSAAVVAPLTFNNYFRSLVTPTLTPMTATPTQQINVTTT